jgi:hypothetical protein
VHVKAAIPVVPTTADIWHEAADMRDALAADALL